MTRVLMLLSNGFTHDPRVANAAGALTRAGHPVTVLAWDRAGTLPPEETRDGVRIVRVRNTAYMRMWPYELFRLRPFWRLAARRAMDLHRQTPFGALHCHDLDTLPAGVAVKRRTGLPLVYDAHEFFPYMIGELSRAKPWEGRFARLERRLTPEAALVVVASPPQREYFAAMTRAPIATVMNTRALLDGGYEPPRNARMRVVYVGGLQADRLLVPLAELAVEDDSFEVEIGGWGPAADPIRALAAKSCGNLRFLGVVPMGEVVPRTRAADVVYCLLDPSKRLFRLAAPNKLFEALVAGRPILVTRGTWAADEVVAADCGLAIQYSKDALRVAIRALQADPAARERMGRNALRLAREKYNLSRDEAALLEAYREVIPVA
jgi:glycosyltransferase involved in cell wall biosynthesis